MPVLKNPYKLKMAKVKVNGEAGGSGSLILEKETEGTNPFEEDCDDNERDSFLDDLSPEGRNPSKGRGRECDRDIFTRNPDEGYRRRATLERLVGLSPFRMGKDKKDVGKEKAQNGEKGTDRKSFLGRIMISLADGEQGPRTPEKRKPRRSSEDFSLLQRFNGRRKESLCSLDCNMAEKENGGSDTLKRMSFLKLGLGGKIRRASLVEKLIQPEASEPEPVPEEVETVAKPKEPLSVLEILNLIHQRDLLTADEHIIDLEAECDQEGQQSPESGESSKDGSRKAKDVNLLYEALLKELWAVLAESLAAKRVYPPLELMVRVIEQEEATDRKWLEAKVEKIRGARPRAVKKRWAEAVRQSVGQRLGECVEGKAGSIAGLMDRLTKGTVEDLCAVKSHLLLAYPKEYEAFGVYLRSYHAGLAQHLADVVQKNLSIADLYFILDWHSNTYPREVLGRAEIAPLVSAHQLGPLLPPETQLSLEESCVSAVKAKIMREMVQELYKEEEKWEQEAKSEDFQFGLSSKVISVMRVHVDKAPLITEEFGRKMAQCCLGCLAEFLQSFQKKVERFHERRGDSDPPAESYMGRTVALINCCPPFRDYVGRLVQFGHPESEGASCRASASLDRVTRVCNRVLADRLFEDLKPYFHKLMKRKWLSNSEAFDSILALLSEYIQKLEKMKQEPYQMLVNEVHRRVLIEYIRPLMQVRIICTSSKMRAKMATKLGDEAQLLKELFIRLKSTSLWLNAAVPHLADILVLEDTPSIQMEVGILVRDFPDVQKTHVSAILDVRGLRNQAQRQEILAVVKDLELVDGEMPLCRERSFFAEIPAMREVRCIQVSFHRLSHVILTCVSRLHRRPQLPARSSTRRWAEPREKEDELRV
uniref:Exocyst complex component 3 like 2 n=1 Tax=Sphenodon punctatus TaxID=8508 RepID=A0A8D0GVE8_SPHPU